MSREYALSCAAAPSIWRAALSFLVILASCAKSQKETTLTSQEIAIDSYVSSYVEENPDSRFVVNGGSWRLVLEEGDGTILVERGDYVRMVSSYYIFSSGKGLNFVPENEAWFTIGNSELLKGVEMGITGAGAGEKCQIIFSAQYGFGDEQVGIVPAMSPIIVEILIKEIEKN